MALRLVALVSLLLLAQAFAQPLRAQDSAPALAEWTGLSAIPLERGHGSVALFGESRVGLGRDLQVGTHVMGLLAPHGSVLWRFLQRGRLHAAVRGGLAYPFPLLSVLTGAGTGALLPVDRKPDQSLMFDLGARLTVDVGRGQLMTLESALVLGPRFTTRDSALLDFPFLYPRFAALEARAVVRLAATGEGILTGPFRWVAALDYWYLPVVTRGFAFEQRAGLAWVAQRRVTLELGGRGSYARYPVGIRFQATPYLDVRVRW